MSTDKGKRSRLHERYAEYKVDLSRAAPVDYTYRRSVGSYFLRSVLHVIAGLVLGFVINWLVLYFQRLASMPAWLAIVVQLLLLILVFYVIERRWHSFAEQWQSTTPGLLFSVVVVGVQFNLWANLSIVGRQLHLT